MAAPRNVVVETGIRLLKDEQVEEEDTPKGAKLDGKLGWEFTAFLTVFAVFGVGLFCIYLTMPAAEYGKLKVPRSVSDLRLLK